MRKPRLGVADWPRCSSNVGGTAHIYDYRPEFTIISVPGELTLGHLTTYRIIKNVFFKLNFKARWMFMSHTFFSSDHVDALLTSQHIYKSHCFQTNCGWMVFQWEMLIINWSSSVQLNKIDTIGYGEVDEPLYSRWEGKVSHFISHS